MEHEVVLAHHRVGTLLLLELMLADDPAVIEDSGLLVLAGEVLGTVVTLDWGDYLDIAVAWQELHVGRAVEEDFARDGRQRVRQIPQLVLAVREATVVLELADARLHEVATDLRLVVRMHSANVVPTRVILRHRLQIK